MNTLRIIFVVFSIFNLTGCLTAGLSETIKDSKYDTKESLSYTITDVYVSNDPSHTIQLGGVNNSFLVFGDSEELKTLLSSPLMEVDDLSLKQDGEFSEYNTKGYKKIYGKMVFIYSFKNSSEDEYGNLLSNTKCQLNDSKQCVFEISDLYGGYDQKPVKIEEQKNIRLQSPATLNVNKYTEHTPLSSFALMVLYPFAIIIDAVTIPVQIFFIPFGMGG